MARTATTKRILLSLYYLVLICVPIAALIYFNVHHFSQSSIQSESPSSSTGLASPSDEAKGMGIYTVGSSLYYEGSCSYMSPTMKLPINPSSFRIFNPYYFGDSSQVWVEWGSGCALPTKADLNPPIDMATFQTINDTVLSYDTHGLISLHSKEAASGTDVMGAVAQRLSPVTDSNFKYILVGTGNAFITYANSVYYYQYGNQTLTAVPGIPTDITQVYDLNYKYYILSKEGVFYYDPYRGKPDTLVNMSGIDSGSLHKLTSDYWADDSHVLLASTTLPGASPKDFTDLHEGYFSSNGNIYYGSRLIAQAPFNPIAGQPKPYSGPSGELSGEACSEEYWTDGHTVFFEGYDLHANAQTFTLNYFPGFKCQATGYVGDGQKFFFAGKLISGADPKTFKVIKNEYARDAYHVYDDGLAMQGDPDQLEQGILNGTIFHDYSDAAY